MFSLYLTYPKCQTLSGKLTWLHYCELLVISDADRRSFYEKECERAGWSVRELKRQIYTSLFERLLLSEGKANYEYSGRVNQVKRKKRDELKRDRAVFYISYRTVQDWYMGKQSMPDYLLRLMRYKIEMKHGKRSWLLTIMRRIIII